ncbi:hypothetical protein EST38_g6616 [Candolleomyces aberdarensis]|uniref:Uncharacterized protein n=1 Tax=Candolleomyces aberdarensis TaxID=2316362 RepID=A0A4V1Q3N9_9AGAR|nr:hypothetical protein EST38_g6616 [Candolleomyces aberdarensis]
MILVDYQDFPDNVESMEEPSPELRNAGRLQPYVDKQVVVYALTEEARLDYTRIFRMPTESQNVRALQRLLPTRAPWSYVAMPPCSRVFDELRNYGAEAGRWVTFTAFAPSGDSYVACGLVLSAYRAGDLRAIVAMVALTKAGFVLMDEGMISWYCSLQPDEIYRDVNRDLLATVGAGPLRRFRYGLELTDLHIHELTLPLTCPPRHLVEMFREVLHEKERRLWKRAEKDLQRLNPSQAVPGAQCKFIEGPMAGAVGKLAVEPARPDGMVRVVAMRNGVAGMVITHPGALTFSLEAGDEVRWTTDQGQISEGFVAGEEVCGMCLVVDKASGKNLRLPTSKLAHKFLCLSTN